MLKEIERLDAVRFALRMKKGEHRGISARRAEILGGYEPPAPGRKASDEAKAEYEAAKSSYESRVKSMAENTEFAELQHNDAELSAHRAELRSEMTIARRAAASAVIQAVSVMGIEDLRRLRETAEALDLPLRHIDSKIRRLEGREPISHRRRRRRRYARLHRA
jgi:hypothetical protein